MTTARKDIVKVEVTRFYHCTSNCVRGAYLCGGKYEYRKLWIEKRLEVLDSIFAISVAGFSVMDSHMHVLIRLDPDDAKNWSDEEVLRRWYLLHPPKGVKPDDKESVNKEIKNALKETKKIADYREKLANLGCFMGALKEPLARLANRHDNCRGAFWEGRYKSIAVLDEEALLTCCAYIDLNPVAAKIAETPETSLYTSVKQRLQHVKEKGKLQSLESAKLGSVKASHEIGNAEQDHWLIPFDDRRPHTHAKPASDREGILEKFTLGNYLLLVEYTGRLFREGKASISEHAKQIFDRLETSFAFWSDRLKKFLAAEKLRGRCFAGSPDGISESVQIKLNARVINLRPQKTSG